MTFVLVHTNYPIKEHMARVLTGADPATEARRASRRSAEALDTDPG
ncbi:hypothetical protein GCM10027074_20260 [Streptomyces deserti]